MRSEPNNLPTASRWKNKSTASKTLLGVVMMLLLANSIFYNVSLTKDSSNTLPSSVRGANVPVLVHEPVPVVPEPAASVVTSEIPKTSIQNNDRIIQDDIPDETPQPLPSSAIRTAPSEDDSNEDNSNNDNEPPKPKTLVIWTYPMPPPDSADTTLEDHEVLYCAYRVACPHHWNNTNTQRIHLRSLTKDTPYYTFVLKHMLMKIVYGKAYPDHVQTITLLAFLSKHNSSSNNSNNQVFCVRSWGDATSILCSNDDDSKNTFGNYHPERYNTSTTTTTTTTTPLAPLIPTSKPNLDTLHFNTFRYPDGYKGNSGDEIQDLTGVQFQPFISDYMNRDRGWKKSKGHVIANAWYGNIINFPPDMQQKGIMEPTFVSMHLSGGGIWSLEQGGKNRPHVLQYLREYYTREIGPIGARDAGTLAFLQEQNITSYLSRCMTLMLQYGCQCKDCPPSCGSHDHSDDGQKKKNNKKTLIVLNDIKKEQLPEEIQKQLQGMPTKYVTADMLFKRDDASFPRSFEYAFDLLETYSQQAKLVITSRLHSALPSFAMGTPVIFVNPKKLPGGGGGRLSGILELLHVYEPGDEWTFPLDDPLPNPGVHIADRNRASLWNYLKRRTSYYEDAGRLHGMIPLRRLGSDRSFPNLFDDFHFVIGDDADLSMSSTTDSSSLLPWQFVRAIEYVLFHHPNARVHVHTNRIPVHGNKLDIFMDTGYQVTVEPYSLPQLLEQGGIPQSLRESFLSDLSSLQEHPKWKEHESDLVKLLVLYSTGGVYLEKDVFLLKPLEKEALKNTVAFADSSLSMLIAEEPQQEAMLKSVQWTLENYKTKIQSADRRLVSEVLSESDMASSLRALEPQDFDPLRDSVAQCFQEALSDLDLSAATAVRIDSSLWTQHTNRDTTCDELLYQHCILCDELHTIPELSTL